MQPAAEPKSESKIGIKIVLISVTGNIHLSNMVSEFFYLVLELQDLGPVGYSLSGGRLKPRRRVFTTCNSIALSDFNLDIILALLSFFPWHFLSFLPGYFSSLLLVLAHVISWLLVAPGFWLLLVLAHGFSWFSYWLLLFFFQT